MHAHGACPGDASFAQPAAWSQGQPHPDALELIVLCGGVQQRAAPALAVECAGIAAQVQPPLQLLGVTCRGAGHGVARFRDSAGATGQQLGVGKGV